MMENHWFCSCLGPTFPNRRFLIAGTADQFFANTDNGTLPSFSIVDPDFGEFPEENPQDIRKGQPASLPDAPSLPAPALPWAGQ